MPRRRANAALLTDPGWAPATRAWLEERIRRGAGRGWPVAFDFDNTLVCGDVGEATLAWLVKHRRLQPETVTALTPPFRTAAGKLVEAARLPDLTAYYEALLEGSGHGAADPNPLTRGYLWAAEVLAGLGPDQVIRATAAVAAAAREGEVRWLEVTPGRTAYPRPWFYPAMVELIAVLLRHRFAVWIVSASNVWSVRWMVLRVLNPRLRRFGVAGGVPPEQVVGVAPLVRDRREREFKDRVLARTDAAYARLEPRALAGLRLTTHLDQPVPVYAGKVACLWDALGRAPYLAAGDSPGDLPMLAFAEHRLWMARVEKPAATAAMRAVQGAAAHPENWVVQPVRTRDTPGFAPEVPEGY
jgi:phosphoserine phosphatase